MKDEEGITSMFFYFYLSFILHNSSLILLFFSVYIIKEVQESFK
jgi:hypothetical protein